MFLAPSFRIIQSPPLGYRFDPYLISSKESSSRVSLYDMGLESQQQLAPQSNGSPHDLDSLPHLTLMRNKQKINIPSRTYLPL